MHYSSGGCGRYGDVSDAELMIRGRGQDNENPAIRG